MRVLRLITRLNIGGPSIQAIALSERLTPRGYTTRLVHGSLGPGEGDMRYLLSPGTAVEQVPRLVRELSPASDYAAYRRIAAILREFRPHIVHTHMAKAGALGRAAAVRYNRSVAPAERTRIVHTYHGHVLEGYFSAAKTALFVGIERLLARATDRIVAISPAIRDELLRDHRIGRAAQYRVVPLGFDLSALAAIDDRARAEARGQLGIPSDAHVVSTVGRLTAIKQHHLFLETARLVANQDAAALFLIVGDGELRADLEQAARDAGLADRVRFLGWRRDLAAIYGASDVFLLTSRNEGTPVALIESLAAGVPGVSTDVGGVRDVITGDDVGLTAAYDDAAGLAAAVATLLGDTERRRATGERGRASVVARYGIERLVDDIDALYRELLG
ncbi:MAG TPA: glycosyltransferase [Vicinamibacterales bacterium]|nr:glycosyltransferase [Vicinamibacterales bacterium]